MFVGMDHVGIAVKSLDNAVHVYRDKLGYRLEGVHILTERKVRIAMFSTGGGTRLELLEPLDLESPVAKFLEARGEGIHHFAIEVNDIEQVLDDLKSKSVILIDETPKAGAEGKRIAFIHPRSTNGVLMELVEKSKR